MSRQDGKSDDNDEEEQLSVPSSAPAPPIEEEEEDVSKQEEDEATENSSGDAMALEENEKKAKLDMLGPAYASPCPPFTFWVETAAVAFLAACCSLFALGYLNIIFEFTKLWTTAQGNSEYPDSAATTGFLDGKPWWIAVGTATGVVIGILKAHVLKFDQYPGFVGELHRLSAEPAMAAKITLCAVVSLMGGASLGPESGLGAGCGGMAMLLSDPVNKLCSWVGDKTRTMDTAEGRAQQDIEQQLLEKEEQEERRRKLLVLAGFVSAFSTLLPSPASALLLCFELAGFERLTKDHGFAYIKTIGQVTFAGTISFLIYTSLEEYTWLQPSRELPGFVYRYEDTDILLALGYACMGALLSLIYFVVGGVVKKVVKKLMIALEERVGRKNRIICVAVLGGTLFGLINYIFPFSIGDGSLQLGTVLVGTEVISTSVLISSCFAKMVAYWICNETGFVGGLFFPLLLMSSLFGRVFVNETNAGWIISMACSIVAMVGAFVPSPLALVMLSLSSFNLGGQGAIPVLICVVTAHMLLVGIGVPQYLLTRPST